mgnify:CR=1 FL=1
MEHTINDVTVGGDSQYRYYESMSVLIIYGDYEVDYMPEPKVSAFANKDESQGEAEEATEEESEEKTIADFKSDHEATESARPSTTAVFPTPGSPIKTGLLFVLRHKTCITLLISFSRPITGSNSPFLASSVKSVPC